MKMELSSRSCTMRLIGESFLVKSRLYCELEPLDIAKKQRVEEQGY